MLQQNRKTHLHSHSAQSGLGNQPVTLTLKFHISNSETAYVHQLDF